MSVTNFYCMGREIMSDSMSGDYMRDALGSTTGTTSPSDGSVRNTFRYKPYGTQLTKTGVGADPQFQWVGTVGYRRVTISHSSIYVRARHFGAEEGKWTTVDPLWPAELKYVYINGNPTTAVDYSGLQDDASSNLVVPRRCKDHSKCPDEYAACQWAKDNGKFVDESGKPILGVPICCNGVAVVCTNDSNPFLLPCTEAHEGSHATFDCICNPAQAGFSVCGFPPGDRKGSKGECRAFNTEVDCLRKKKCAVGDEACKTELRKRICTACKGSNIHCLFNHGGDYHWYCTDTDLKEECKKLGIDVMPWIKGPIMY